MAEEKNLQTSIDKLTQRMDHANSLWRVMLRGLLAGVAGALGASIIAAAAITILSLTIRSIYDVPVLGNILQSEPIESILEGGGLLPPEEIQR